MTQPPPIIAAIVVGFFPTINTLENLLHNLHGQVQQLYLIDNGGCQSVNLTTLPHCQRITLEKNYGLGHALNIGFHLAHQYGASYVATFDQDSTPPHNLISTLLSQHELLQAQGINCAAVGPTFFDQREARPTYFPFYKEINQKIIAQLPANNLPTIEVDVLITSGMLVRTEAWLNKLCYDEDMFIDYTDTEWCFRARKQGYQLFGCTSIQMGHALSDAPPIRFFNLKFFHYSALRRYYYFRNTILLCRKNYVSSTWKKRLLIGLILRLFVSLLYEPNRLTQFAMMCKGIWHGLRNKHGVYQ